MGLFDSVNKDDEKKAISRVASGQGSARDHEIARKAGQHAGSTGNDARRALEESAKKADKPRGLFG